MKKNGIYFLLLLLILVLVVVFYFLFKSKGSNPTITPPTSSPQQEPIPPTSGLPLELLQVNPTNTFVSNWSIEPILLTFNQPIDSNSIQYQVSPATETKISLFIDDPNSFNIVPLSGWNENQDYTITVSSITSKSGSRLNQPITFTIRREPLPEDYFPKVGY